MDLMPVIQLAILLTLLKFKISQHPPHSSPYGFNHIPVSGNQRITLVEIDGNTLAGIVGALTNYF